jgi:hypothetical protein
MVNKKTPIILFSLIFSILLLGSINACNECSVYITKPTSGWYGNSIEINWAYSSNCIILPDQDIIFTKDGVKKLIKNIGNTNDRKLMWNPIQEGKNFRVCIDTELSGTGVEVEGCSKTFGIDLTAPIITALNKDCSEGDIITLEANATDTLSGINSSSWSWDTNNDGVYETLGQNVIYNCASSGIAKVKVYDNVGNIAETSVNINVEPICENLVSVKYSYNNSYQTGIAIKPQEGEWISGLVNVSEGIYDIKYYIDNNKEEPVYTNIKLNIDNMTLLDYNESISTNTYKSISVNLSEFCGEHIIYLKVETEEDCDLLDNYAQRQIYVQCDNEPIEPPINPICGDGIVNQDSEECDGGSDCDSYCKIIEDEKDKHSSSTLIEFNECLPNWKCESWGECINGITKRKCYDANECSYEINRPIETNLCVNEVIMQSVEKKDNGGTFLLLVGFFLLLVILLLLLKLK